jgi:hypothetical protein
VRPHRVSPAGEIFPARWPVLGTALFLSLAAYCGSAFEELEHRLEEARAGDTAADQALAPAVAEPTIRTAAAIVAAVEAAAGNRVGGFSGANTILGGLGRA